MMYCGNDSPFKTFIVGAIRVGAINSSPSKSSTSSLMGFANFINPVPSSFNRFTGSCSGSGSRSDSASDLDSSTVFYNDSNLFLKTLSISFTFPFTVSGT